MKNPFWRGPDFIVGPKGDPYLFRWWVIPKNKIFNIYLHKFIRSDDDRALHDHPWWSLGFILRGRYLEELPADVRRWRDGDRTTVKVLRRAFRPVLRRPEHIHRVELIPPAREANMVKLGLMTPEEAAQHSKPVWTLFITGPKIREWGFWCPRGWKFWEQFVEVRPGGNAVGPGCED